jgi:adenine C2-methylase RlmN of 23S rRNA A2503 and tRNA A37
MNCKNWNVRDQTSEALKDILRKKYKEIDREYRMIRKVSNIDDAKKIVDEIWQMKNFANAIEMELMRREFEDGTTS